MHRGLLLSSDIKSRCWPWASQLASAPLAAPGLSDPVWQFVPWLRLARRELAAGELPLWNPHQEGGVPLLANAQSALASPLAWPALLLGVEAGWNLSLLARILVAAGAAFAWLRDLGRSRGGAALGAIAFALSGPFVAWLEHPQTLVAAAVPMLLLFARRAAGRASTCDAAGLALSGFLVLAGGHPETALMAVMLAVAVAGREWSGRRAAAAVGGGALLGAGLAGPVLLPFLEYFWWSAARLGEGRRPFTLSGRDLLRFVLPAVPGSNVIEAAASVSVVLLLLVPLGLVLRRDRETRFWGLALLAMLLVVYDNPISRALALQTPVHWTRFLLFAPLAFGVLGSAGFDALRDRLAARGRAGAKTALSMLVLAAVLAELLFRARGVHAVTPQAQVSPTTPLIRFLENDRDIFRILPLHNFLPPNSATDYALDDVRGYDALSVAGWRGQRAAIGRFGPTPILSDAIEPWDLAPGGRALDFWNVKYLLLDPRFPDTAETFGSKQGLDLEQVYSGADGRVFQNRRVLPRARLDVPGSVQLIGRAANQWRFQVALARPGTFLLANPLFPGWRAFLDGRRAALDSHVGAPIALRVPAGRHTLEIVYHPLSWRLGLATFVVSAAALLALAWPRTGPAGARGDGSAANSTA
jgi:hypothetical protein